MPTRPLRHRVARQGLELAATIALGAALGLAAAAAVGGGATGVGSLPSDVAGLAPTVTAMSPEGMVAFTDAEQEVLRVYGAFPDASTESFLVRLSDPSLLGGIRDRPLWIVRVSGVRWDTSRPLLSDGTGAGDGETSPLRTLYAYVDARTGEWLMSRLED